MSNNKSAAITYSKYLKKDVYEMLRRTLASGELETACYMSAELVCTPDELLTLCSFFVDVLVSRDVVATTLLERFPMSTVMQLSDALRNVHQIVVNLYGCHSRKKRGGDNPYNPSESYCRDSRIREEICKMAVFLCAEKCKQPARLFSNAPGKTTTKIKGNSLSEKSLEYDLLSMCNTGSSSTELKIIRAFLPVELTGECLKMLLAVYDACSKANTAYCISLVEFCVKRVQSCVNFSRLDLPEIRTVPAKQRNDIVWYLWRLCLLITDGDRKRFVSHALHLYQFEYRKPYRLTRLTLLLAAYEVAIEGCDIVTTPDADAHGSGSERKRLLQKTAKKALDGIQIVYDDIIGRKEYQDHEGITDLQRDGDVPVVYSSAVECTVVGNESKKPQTCDGNASSFSVVNESRMMNVNNGNCVDDSRARKVSSKGEGHIIGSREVDEPSNTDYGKRKFNRDVLYYRDHDRDSHIDHDMEEQYTVDSEAKNPKATVAADPDAMYFCAPIDYELRHIIQCEIDNAREEEESTDTSKIHKNVRIKSCFASGKVGRSSDGAMMNQTHHNRGVGSAHVRKLRE
jgi:hypothetical protein